MEVIKKHDLSIAADFFFKFARFEYALKAAGYRNQQGEVKPDWKKLADELEATFLNPEYSVEFAKAINYYENYPPMKQVIVNNQLKWSKVEPNTNSFSHKILLYVCRVRNNLFHGGKFKGKYLSAPERSELLMKHGLIILDACLALRLDLKRAYEGM
jgi:hypothetical protein